MATKNSAPAATLPAATVDPLAGLPTPATAAAAPAPTPIAKARKGKNRLSGQNLRDAVDFARKQTGYDDTSPIWNKKAIEVYVAIEAELVNAEAAMDRGELADAAQFLANGLLLNRELQKRTATNQLVAAQR